MLSILLVDDEALVLRMLKSEVDWARLGVDRVITAQSMRQAVQVFSEGPVDILLCDIEMPRGSGLDLLRRLKEEKREVVSILLTAHADFRYAREAVALGAIDYIMKPAPLPTLEDVIARAVERVRRTRSTSDYVAYGKNWVVNRRFLLERFWQDVLRESVEPQRGALLSEMAARRIETPLLQTYALLQAMLRVPSDDHSGLSPHDLDFCVQNILQELTGAAAVVSPGEGVWTCILEDGAQGEAAYLALCARASEAMEMYLHVALTCCAMEGVAPERAASQSRRIRRYVHNRMDQQRAHFFPAPLAHEDSECGYKKPAFESWRGLLRACQADALERQVSDYLSRLASKGVVPERVLSYFLHDFLQMVYAVLEGEGIQSAALLSDGGVQDLLGRAPAGASDMLRFCGHVVRACCRLLRGPDDPVPVSEQICRYIKSHLEEDLSREEIAAHVGLSPEYVSRLFKQETGVNLVSYLQTVRLSTACDWLTHSGLSISEIAARLGYDNFAYFSKIFKKYTGLTPSAYRKDPSGARMS